MIDLHVHSTMSDGTYTPSELIRLAKDKHLKMIALTDHDTIAGNAEAKEMASKHGIEFMKGIELSLNYHNHQIHVVALGFDEESTAFKDFYTDLRYKKQASIVNVIEYLHQQGLDISVNKVEPFMSGGVLDKYAILRYLVANKSQSGDIQYLWDTYIDPAFRDLNLKITENPMAEEAIVAMKKAGAITSLAHFHKKIGLKNYSRTEQEAHIKYLHEIGLDGMEAYYPNYTKDDEAFAHYLIDKYDLVPTGGTDFHGANRPAVKLGTGIDNNLTIPYALYENICQKLNK